LVVCSLYVVSNPYSLLLLTDNKSEDREQKYVVQERTFFIIVSISCSLESLPRERERRRTEESVILLWKRRARVSKWLLENRFILVEQTSAKGNMFLCTN